MIAHYTNGNVLIVKKLLGHKRVENSMKYIGMINFKDDEFEVATATDVEEAKKVLSAGFDYVTEKNGIMLFKRPKSSASMYDKRRTTRIKLYLEVFSLESPERVRGAVRIARQPSNALLGVKRAESHGFKSHRTRSLLGSGLAQRLYPLNR